MAQNSILITSISKKIPLIEGVKKAAKKIGGTRFIHGCDTDPQCLGRYFVDYFWQTAPIQHLTREQVRDYCRHHQITAIIPTRNGDLEFYAQHKDWLKGEGIQTMVSAESVIKICLDKKHFSDWMIENHFPVIPTALSIDEIKAHHFVVKDRYGAGSLSIGLKLEKQTAITHAKNLKNPIFQPFIEGIEYSVDLYRDLSGTIKGCISRRRDLVINGESQVTTTVRKPKIEKLCVDMANKMNLYGHAVFQVIESADQTLHVVECNPRFGGASTASIAVGLDTFYWFLLESSGQSLDSHPFHRSEKEIRQVRYPVDHITKL